MFVKMFMSMKRDCNLECLIGCRFMLLMYLLKNATYCSLRLFTGVSCMCAGSGLKHV